MKKGILPFVKAGFLGVVLALATNGLEFGYRAMGIELEFTREDVWVLMAVVIIGFRHWICPPKDWG